MVSLNIQLLATILLITEGYSQLAGCGCYPPGGCSPGGQRCGCGPAPGAPACSPAPCQPAVPTNSIVPYGQFIIPAIIKPLISPTSCPGPSPAPGCRSSSAGPCAPSSCADNDDSELERQLYRLISQLIDNRKCQGKKSGYSPNIVCDDSSDYGAVGNYGDDYEYGQSQPSAYCPPASSDNSCPEITVRIRPCEC